MKNQGLEALGALGELLGGILAAGGDSARSLAGFWLHFGSPGDQFWEQFLLFFRSFFCTTFGKALGSIFL